MAQTATLITNRQEQQHPEVAAGAEGGRVVVGLDRSAASSHALDWAADFARGTGSALEVICVVEPLPAPIRLSTVPPGAPNVARPGESPHLQQLVDEHWELVERTVSRLRRQLPAPVTGDVLTGEPGRLLRDAAGPDAVLVVGSRGEQGFDGLLTGSTCEWLAAHGRGTVVVVRGEGGPGPQASVIVGIDWHQPAHGAVRFAQQAAACWNAPLIGVGALGAEPPGWTGSSENRPDPWEVHDPLWTEQAVLAHNTVRAALDDPGTTRTPPQVLIRYGSPAAVIVENSSGAGLVVIGSHGRGRIRSLLLGSVGRQLIHHSRCSIAVVHSSDEDHTER